MSILIPLPPSVRNISSLITGRGAGDASYGPGDRAIEWRLSSREVQNLMERDRGGGVGVTVTLRGTVVGSSSSNDDDEGDLDGGPVSFATSTYDYDDETSSTTTTLPQKLREKPRGEEMDKKRIQANKTLMPSCATVSFSVKGWLPSEIRVESLNVDVKRSKGLGSGVTPYKGVKYLAVSRRGVECRC
jgi:AP-3 complex subunit mu